MRVMLMVFPTRTHIYSMAPVGWALAAAGHEVRFVGQRNPREDESFQETGLDAMFFGAELDIARHRKLEVDGDNAMHGEFLISETRRERYTDEYVRTVHDHWVDVYRWTTPDAMVDEILRFAKVWRPDLVVWDPLVYAAPIVAHALGVPHLRMMYAADQTARVGHQYKELMSRTPAAERTDSFVDWMGAAVGRLGKDFDESLRYGTATIDCHPTYLRYDGVEVDYIEARFAPMNKPMAIPRWVLEKPERPRVMLTLGVSNRQVLGVEETSVAALLDGLADLDVDVIATLNATQLATVERVPDNVRAIDFVPMNELLESCSAIVHQGGGATIGNAVVNGVPQLIIPGTTWSERASALAQCERGNGLMLDLADVTPESVRAGLNRLLTEPSFKDCAEQVRREVAATPTLDDLVPELERLAGCG